MNKKFNKKLIISFIIAVGIYLLSYLIPKVAVAEEDYHYLASSLDDKIKLFSPMIVIYLLSYFQWMSACLIACKRELEKGYRFASSIIIGSIIGLIIFMVYPTAIVRPEIVGNSLFDRITRIVYTVDSNVNACPSFHCFCSTLVLLGLSQYKDINKGFFIFNIIFSILVYISTILTKQHVLIDVPCGILLAIVAFIISKRFIFKKSFDKINNLFNIK